MRFLLNMNGPRGLGRRLTESGHVYRHVGDIGMARARDSAIVEKARESGEVIVTHDLDYGYLLAFSGQQSPSVIITSTPQHTSRQPVSPHHERVAGDRGTSHTRRDRFSRRCHRACATSSHAARGVTRWHAGARPPHRRAAPLLGAADKVRRGRRTAYDPLPITHYTPPAASD